MISRRLYSLAEQHGALCNCVESERYGLPCPARFLIRTDHLSIAQMAMRYGISKRTVNTWRTKQLKRIDAEKSLCVSCRTHSALQQRLARIARREEDLDELVRGSGAWPGDSA